MDSEIGALDPGHEIVERRPATGTSENERDALRRSRRMSHLLDEAVRVPGTDFRVGLDPLLGILPVGGDAVGLALSLYPIIEALRLDLPRSAILRMFVNVAVDAAVGSIPIVGTLFDAVWKANERNVAVLERYLDS